MHRTLLPLLALLTLSAAARAEEAPLGHGPSAGNADFPSHRFQLAPRRPPAQLSFHYGLLQPILLGGFNAAVDLRVDRFIATYSHGQGLRTSDAPGALSQAETDAGVTAFTPWTTGFGLGVTLVDELYALVDFKWHRYEVEAGPSRLAYTTFTFGGELGYRFFLWRGLHIAPVVRYWPTVWTSASEESLALTVNGERLQHAPIQQGAGGVFANLLVGWSFDLVEPAAGAAGAAGKGARSVGSRR